MSFQKDVKTLRRKLDLTQRELAEILGVNRETVASWEVGMKNPSRMAQRFVRHLLECRKEQKDG